MSSSGPLVTELATHLPTVYRGPNDLPPGAARNGDSDAEQECGDTEEEEATENDQVNHQPCAVKFIAFLLKRKRAYSALARNVLMIG